MKTLKITIKKYWYDAILSGRKIHEYREYKPFWISRLVDKKTGGIQHYDRLEMRNGYEPTSPVALVSIKKISIDKIPYDGKLTKCFIIHLGEVIEKT